MADFLNQPRSGSSFSRLSPRSGPIAPPNPPNLNRFAHPVKYSPAPESSRALSGSTIESGAVSHHQIITLNHRRELAAGVDSVNMTWAGVKCRQDILDAGAE
jgi:hypothetical protein